MGCGGIPHEKDINENINNNIDNMRNELLKNHNKYRKYHNSNDLKMNNDLNKKAQEYANEIIDAKFKQSTFHNIYKNSILGENTFCSKEKVDPKKICHEWYKENKKYDYEKNSYLKGTGHFTQLVWKNTKEVGFGISSNNDNFRVVAYYYPAGNILGEFQNNVLEKNEFEQESNI